MITIIYVASIIAVLSMMIFLLLRKLGNRIIPDSVNPFSLLSLALTAFLLILDMLSGGDIGLRYVSDLLLVIIPFSFSTSSIRQKGYVRYVLLFFLFFQFMQIIHRILYLSGLIEMWDADFFVSTMRILGFATFSALLAGFYTNLRDIRIVMKSGTVWNNLELVSDTIYFMSIPLLISVASLDISIVLAMLILAALGVRVGNASLFVICQRQERRILESMKLSQIEIVNNVHQDVYKELYERLVSYFEQDRPYLNHNLTINDVSRIVFSNRLYISRAINQYTGRNFCQFVNFYRITYSIEYFRENPEVRISELSTISGFNSVVSYNMAFRLFMNETPGEWFRKERHKLRKKKK